jgi:hypothetical protein
VLRKIKVYYVIFFHDTVASFFLVPSILFSTFLVDIQIISYCYFETRRITILRSDSVFLYFNFQRHDALLSGKSLAPNVLRYVRTSVSLNFDLLP